MGREENIYHLRPISELTAKEASSRASLFFSFAEANR